MNFASGHLAELMLAFELQSRKSFPLSAYFKGFPKGEPVFKVKEVLSRIIQDATGEKMEVDIMVKSTRGHI